MVGVMSSSVRQRNAPSHVPVRRALRAFLVSISDLIDPAARGINNCVRRFAAKWTMYARPVRQASSHSVHSLGSPYDLARAVMGCVGPYVLKLTMMQWCRLDLEYENACESMYI